MYPRQPSAGRDKYLGNLKSALTRAGWLTRIKPHVRLRADGLIGTNAAKRL